MIAIRLGSVQLAGLQCHAESDADRAGCGARPYALDRGVLSFDEADRADVVACLEDAAGSAHEQAEIDRGGVTASMDRAMGTALEALAERARRVGCVGEMINENGRR